MLAYQAKPALAVSLEVFQGRVEVCCNRNQTLGATYLPFGLGNRKRCQSGNGLLSFQDHDFLACQNDTDQLRKMRFGFMDLESPHESYPPIWSFYLVKFANA